MNLVGDPAAIRSLAATLRRRAGELDAVGRRVQDRAESCTWMSARADRFRARMARDRARTAGLAHELVDIAVDLDRLATQVEQEIETIYRLEHAVRALIAGFVSTAEHVVAPWTGTQWGPGHLPPPGDPAWHDCARQLGVR